MSRIGNKIITISAGVEVKLDDNTATVKGPKGELTRTFSKNIEIFFVCHKTWQKHFNCHIS